MTFLKVAPVVLGLALVSGTFSPRARADDYDKKTTITFSAPVAIPPVHLQGFAVLPAGTYVFKLLNSSSNRHIVQIFNADQTKIFATVLAIANYRLTPTDKTVITFNEGVRDRPEAIRAWFYPGANWGEEFVYPKTQAVELAKITKVPVLAVTADLKAEVEKPEEPEVIVQLQRAPLVAVRPTGEEVEIAQVVQTAPQVAPAVEVALAPAPIADARLPETASSMPLIALFGILAMGGGLTLMAVRKCSSLRT
jgi:LPXTG-motif cell wall-anchored protein